MRPAVHFQCGVHSLSSLEVGMTFETLGPPPMSRQLEGASHGPKILLHDCERVALRLRGLANSWKTVPAQPVVATPPVINLFPKGGVRDAKTMEVVFGPAGRYVEPLEGWTVVTCDWSSTGQG